VTDADVERLRQAPPVSRGPRRSAAGRIRQRDADVALLALGFARGEPVRARRPLRPDGGRGVMAQLASRANVVSSFTVVKGAMIEETYAVFAAWDFETTKRENLDRLRDDQLHRREERDLAPRRRQGAEPALRSRRP
jgi:hypothetical protein